MATLAEILQNYVNKKILKAAVIQAAAITQFTRIGICRRIEVKPRFLRQGDPENVLERTFDDSKLPFAGELKDRLTVFRYSKRLVWKCMAKLVTF